MPSSQFSPKKDILLTSQVFFVFFLDMFPRSLSLQLADVHQQSTLLLLIFFCSRPLVNCNRRPVSLLHRQLRPADLPTTRTVYYGHSFYFLANRLVDYEWRSWPNLREADLFLTSSIVMTSGNIESSSLMTLAASFSTENTNTFPRKLPHAGVRHH